jgi:hypothetical protein
MKQLTSRTALITGLVAGGLLTVMPVLAANELPSIVPACARLGSGPAPDLNCALQTFDAIAKLAIGIVGALVLLMFVYGGFKVIYSSGNASKAKEGLGILRNAVIGMLIVLLAGYLVEYGLAQMKIITVGSSCFVNNTEGLYREVRGTTKCVLSCAQLKNEQYACTDITKLGGNVAGCLTGLCKETAADAANKNVQCCPIENTPAAPTAPASAPKSPPTP